jgi:hypothetical protein
MIVRSYEKKGWRQRNAEWVKKAQKLPGQSLFNESKKLRGRILDLAGEDVKEVYSTYRVLLEDPKDLLLVEYDKSTWRKAATTWLDLPEGFRPRLIYNDGYSLLSALNNRTRQEDTGSLVGAISLDTVNNTGSQWWDKTEIGLFGSRGSVTLAVEEFGVCVLILNHTLDGRKGLTDSLVRLEDHISRLRSILGPYNGGYGKPHRNQLAPSKKRVKELVLGNSEGWWGAIQVYRSEDKLFRMATIRLHLLPGRFYIDRGD